MSAVPRKLASAARITASRFGAPLVSCLRSALSRSRKIGRTNAPDRTNAPERPNADVIYTPMGRDGSSLRLGGTLTKEYAFEGQFQVGSVVFGSDATRKFKTRNQTGKLHPKRCPLLKLCAAIMLARCIALQVGTPVTLGWPALWKEDEVSFFMPRCGSETPALHWVSYVENCTVWTCTREVALQWCTPEWNSFYHLGSVPTPIERQLGHDSNFAHIDATDLVYDPRDAHLYNDGWLAMYDDDDLIHGPDHHGEKSEALPTPSSAMSVGRASESSGSINADEWLMDTGSGVDIVSRASVAGCKRFVTKN
jgi:hypothetical protein